MQKKNDTSLLGMGEMIDHVTGAVARQVRTQILPVVQSDRELQRNLARGLGEGLGDKIAPAAALGAAALLVFAGCYAYKTFSGARKS